MALDKYTGEVIEDKGLAKEQEKPSSTEREELSDLDVLKTDAKIIEELYDKENVGMIQGSGWLNTAKSTTGIGVNSDNIKFRQLIDDCSDRLLRARSGAQINEHEYKRLRKLLPDPSMSEKDFKARLKGFQEELDRVISIEKQGLSSVGLKIPEFNKGQQQDISNGAVNSTPQTEGVTKSGLRYTIER